MNHNYIQLFRNKMSAINMELVILEDELSAFKIIDENGPWKREYHAFAKIIQDGVGASCILRMSKLIIDKRDSLSVFSLINFIQGNFKRIVKETDKDKTIKKIGEFKNYLNSEEITKFRKVIETVRDKLITHLDKTLANKGRTIKATLDIIQFKGVIKEVANFLKFCWGIIDTEYVISGADKGEAADQAKEVFKILNTHFLNTIQ
jgi:hypothetical protein